MYKELHHYNEGNNTENLTPHILYALIHKAWNKELPIEENISLSRKEVTKDDHITLSTQSLTRLLSK